MRRLIRRAIEMSSARIPLDIVHLVEGRCDEHCDRYAAAARSSCAPLRRERRDRRDRCKTAFDIAPRSAVAGLVTLLSRVPCEEPLGTKLAHVRGAASRRCAARRRHRDHRARSNVRERGLELMPSPASLRSAALPKCALARAWGGNVAPTGQTHAPRAIGRFATTGDAR